MMRCIYCGRQTASVSASGVSCNTCGNAWTFEHEQANKVYITSVLNRKLAVPPVELPPVMVDAEPATSVENPDHDDLTELDGVGPKLAKRLNEAGYFSFWDISRAEPVKLSGQVDGVHLGLAVDLINQAAEFVGNADLLGG